jgi:hypothetical protein
MAEVPVERCLACEAEGVATRGGESLFSWPAPPRENGFVARFGRKTSQQAAPENGLAAYNSSIGPQRSLEITPWVIPESRSFNAFFCNTKLST